MQHRKKGDALMSRYVPRQLYMLLVLLLVAFVAPVAAPAAAQGSASMDVEVLNSAAQVDFPSSITFSLVAQNDGAPITEAALLYGASRADTRTIVPLSFTPGRSVEVQHRLDTRIYHLPVGVEVSYSWLLRDADGNEFETPVNELIYHDDRFTWQQRSERGITVYWYAGGDRFGDALIGTATGALDRLQVETGVDQVDPIKIYIYENTSDMRAALRSNSVEWVGGQAVPSLGLIIGAVAPDRLDEVGRIVPHELSHQVLYQATENPYGGVPLWFEEGLAVYNQEAVDDYFADMIDAAARSDTLVPLEALAASFPTDPDRALLSYAQSHSIVAYIIDTYGTEKLSELVAAFRDATPVDEALPQVLGVTVDELDAAWRETLPPAEFSVELEGSPDVAPESRFDALAVPASGNTGSSGAPPQPLPDPQPEQPMSLIPGLALAPWVEWTIVALACSGSMVVGGAVLLLGLRLVRAGGDD
jgi:hypothetical protein